MAKKKDFELYSYRAENASIRDQFEGLLQKLVSTNSISEREKLERISRFTSVIATLKNSKKAFNKNHLSHKVQPESNYGKTSKSNQKGQENEHNDSDNEEDYEENAQNELPIREINQQGIKAAGKKTKSKGARLKEDQTKTLKKRPESGKRK